MSRNFFSAWLAVVICCLSYLAIGRAADVPPQLRGPAAGPPPVQAPPAMSGEQRIKARLGDDTSLDFQGVPLNEAMDYIADKHSLPIMLDEHALKDAGIDPTTTQVTMPIRHVSLRSALDLILAPLNLTTVIKDEVLQVTSKAKADAMFSTRLYDVRDLVVHDHDPMGQPDFDSLIDAIRMTVSPQSWDKAGGQGSMAPVDTNGVCALLVWQNYHGHEQFEGLLTELRRLKPQRAVNQ